MPGLAEGHLESAGDPGRHLDAGLEDPYALRELAVGGGPDQADWSGVGNRGRKGSQGVDLLHLQS